MIDLQEWLVTVEVFSGDSRSNGRSFYGDKYNVHVDVYDSYSELGSMT